MELALIGLALILILIVVFVIPLAVLRAGIRRQHRAASLTCQPRSVSAALTRRAVGLYVRKPSSNDKPDPVACERWALSDGRRPASWR
jgi:hypothetical protein